MSYLGRSRAREDDMVSGKTDKLSERRRYLLGKNPVLQMRFSKVLSQSPGTGLIYLV